MNPGEDSARGEIGVVVLNYNDFASTLSCVRTLLSCVPKPRWIVVVDNDSPNESFEVLSAELGGIANLEVINSGRNGGYSYGNNVGIRRMQVLGLRHVVIATSDTEVLSKDLFARLLEAIDERTGAVAPQIIASESLQNPSVDHLSLKYVLDLFWIQLGMPGLTMRRAASRLARLAWKSLREHRIRTSSASTKCEETVRTVYKLHGSFICLTENFLSKVGLLNERLFMFGEEDLWAWACLEHGLDQRLLTNKFVRHASDSSVDLTWGRQARKFTDAEQRKSGRVLRSEIDIRKVFLTWLRSASGVAAPSRARHDG